MYIKFTVLGAMMFVYALLGSVGAAPPSPPARIFGRFDPKGK